MKFASFPKFALLLPLACVFVLALAGCGAGRNLALTQGNWAVTATSTNTGTIAISTFYIGGNLTQTGSSVSGTMYIVGSDCFDSAAPIAITGTVKEKKVTLTTASYQEQVITVTASGTSNSGTSASTLSGTYTVTGGCAGGDKGTVTANAVPSISGTWNGTLALGTNGIAAPTLSIALTQAATASADGTFALTGAITYTNSGCSVSGTISSGTLAGNFILINAFTIETDDSDGAFSYQNVLLDSPTAPKNMTGTYDVGSGLCPGLQTLTLTKQ